MRAEYSWIRTGLLPLVAAALLVSTGCRDKTVIINIPPGEVPTPEGDSSREEAEALLEEAYEAGRRTGRQSVWAQLSEDEREERREARERRQANWGRRRQQLRREILVDTLADRYGQEYETLVAAWEQNNQGEEFTCDESVEEDPVEPGTPLPEDEDEEGTPEEVPGTVENLDCWSRLCPGVASVIAENSIPEPDRRDRRGRRGPDGWMGHSSSEGVDFDEVGVELPDQESICAEDLEPLLEEAYKNGFEAGEEQANLSEEERDERAEERWAAREQDLKERLERRLRRRLRRAVEACAEDAEDERPECEDEDQSCDADEDLPEEDAIEIVPDHEKELVRVRRSVHRWTTPDGTEHEVRRVSRVRRVGGLVFEGQTDDLDEN